MGGGKLAGLTAGFVATFAAGVWIGTAVTAREPRIAPDAVAPLSDRSPEATVAVPEPVRRPIRVAAPRRAETAPATTTFAPVVPTVSVNVTSLHERIRPLLNRGANMDIVSEGFANAEDFASVAHASQNLDVPFMVLKHRLVEKGKSLADAISELKPDVNAAVEADRARAEARADIASL